METVTSRPANAAPEKTLQKPDQSTLRPQPRLCRLGDLLDEWQSEAQAAHEARVMGIKRGPVTGMKKLDHELGGALPCGLTIVHGQPGVGKTAFGLQVAAECGFAALYVTCEMSPLELLRRHTARVTKQYLQRFKSGEMRPADSLEFARRAAAAAPNLVLVDATRAPAEPKYLRECAEIARLQAANTGADARHVLLVVDSLHSWAEGLATFSSAGWSGAGDSSEYELLNAALMSLRGLAHELACPVLCIAERNRDSMKSGGLSAGAGTRKLEYSAECVIDLRRAEEAGRPRRENAEGEVEVEAALVKNRNGAAGATVPLLFHGATQTFASRAS